MPTNNWFERNPKKTIGCLVLLVFLAADLGIGHFWCPKIVGTLDAYYHHDLPKNYTGPRDWGYRQYELVTNSLGFKDKEVRRVPRTSDRRRIVFLGDSFTEGVGYSYAETFPGLFASRVAARGVEVLNAGVTSYSPKLYYLKTKYLLNNVHLDFDELIVFIDISDIQDEIAYEPFVPSAHFGISRFYLIHKVRSFLKQNSLTYYFFWSRRQADASSPQPDPGNDGEYLINEQEMADHWYIETSLWTTNERVYEKWGERGVRSALAYMDRLCELCRERGIEMTLAVYPWPTQILARDLESRQVRVWRSFCDERKIAFLNLFPHFINEELAEVMLERYFIEEDVHWNMAGHAMVADVLHEKWASGQ